MRWSWDGDIFAVQWVDNKLVTLSSSIVNAYEYVESKCKNKTENKWNNLTVKQTLCYPPIQSLHEWVDRSDQILAKYNLLRESLRWWKTLFYHFIELPL